MCCMHTKEGTHVVIFEVNDLYVFKVNIEPIFMNTYLYNTAFCTSEETNLKLTASFSVGTNADSCIWY